MNPYEIAERIGLNGGWVKLRMFWSHETKSYSKVEQSFGGKVWEPFDEANNVVSIRYINGPKDGKVEW